MLVPRPTGSHVAGAAPKRRAPDALSLNLRASISPQQRQLDLQEIQSWFQSGAVLGGLWLPDRRYQTTDAAGTTPVTATGDVVGRWTSADGLAYASQNTTGNKPTAQITPQTQLPWLTADATDVVPVVFPSSLGSACTIARATPTGVEFADSQTVNATWNDLIRPYQYNSAVLVANRAPTTYERAVIGRVLGRYAPVVDNNIAINGNFSQESTSGWSQRYPGSFSIVNGELELVSSGSACVAEYVVPTVAGGMYCISFGLHIGSANTGNKSAGMRIYNDSGNTLLTAAYSVSVSSLENFQLIITADGLTRLWFVTASASGWGDSGNKAYIDNISIFRLI